MSDKFFNVFLITFLILIIAYWILSNFSSKTLWFWMNFVLLPIIYVLVLEIISAVFLGWDVIEDRETEVAIFVGMIVSVIAVMVYRGVVHWMV